MFSSRFTCQKINWLQNLRSYAVLAILRTQNVCFEVYCENDEYLVTADDLTSDIDYQSNNLLNNISIIIKTTEFRRVEESKHHVKSFS